MINIIRVSFIFFPLFNLPKDFYYRQSQCSFSYSITKEWHLELKTDENFMLFSSIKDTRFKKSLLDTLVGKWDFLNDTLKLIPEQRRGNFSDKINFPDKIIYTLKKDGLERVAFNPLLPEIMRTTK
jgi:hypothetical protein